MEIAHSDAPPLYMYIILVVSAFICFRLKHDGAEENENVDPQPKGLTTEPQKLDHGRETLLSSLKGSTIELALSPPPSEMNDITIACTCAIQQRSALTDWRKFSDFSF